LSEINRRSQEFIGRFVPDQDVPRAEEIQTFVRELPPAANAAERSLLKAKLLDLAFRWSSDLVDKHQEPGAVLGHTGEPGVHPWILSRTFRDEFGCSPHDFLTRIRIAKAVPMLAKGEKTEAVALEVGYRSKKSLFSALKKLTGLRPSEIGQLSRGEIAAIVERLNPNRN
jgi:hypothetical protein